MKKRVFMIVMIHIFAALLIMLFSSPVLAADKAYAYSCNGAGVELIFTHTVKDGNTFIDKVIDDEGIKVWVQIYDLKVKTFMKHEFRVMGPNGWFNSTFECLGVYRSY